MIQFGNKGPGRHAILLAIACFFISASMMPAWAQPQITTQSDDTKYAGEFIVPINKSQVLRLDVPVADLLVGNSEIADVLALTDRTIYVLGRSLGSTSLTIYGQDRSLIAVMDLVITHDIEAIKARLFDFLPEESIEVRPVGGSVVLTGTVASASRLSRAVTIVEQMAPGQVTNLLSVKGSQQVMLEVRFSEVSRDITKELGLNFDFSFGDFVLDTGEGLRALAFGFGLGTLTTGSMTLDLLFDALEKKGLVKTLAEPNLIALSGDTASFLAGGEFPVPVAQEADAGGNAITVEFREFGVSLAFTPTVLDDGLINIIVTPEVSTIDPTNSVTLSGFNIPGLSTRRATTTVELRDGQSFAIAGLLQNDFQDTVRQFPVLGDVPILGALFRSTNFQRSETELVIVITPRLVKPVPAGTLVTPADTFIPPSDIDLWFFGRPEAPGSGLAGVQALSEQGVGGIEGQYGHIIK